MYYFYFLCFSSFAEPAAIMICPRDLPSLFRTSCDRGVAESQEIIPLLRVTAKVRCGFLFLRKGCLARFDSARDVCRSKSSWRWRTGRCFPTRIWSHWTISPHVLQPDVTIFSLGIAIPISWRSTPSACAHQIKLTSRLKWLRRVYIAVCQ